MKKVKEEMDEVPKIFWFKQLTINNSPFKISLTARPKK
jgi:hypothetical protein